MPRSLSSINLWDYTWGIVSTLALLVLLAIIVWKLREWYSDTEGEACDWQTSLTDYRELQQNGLITPEEFQKIKQRIISKDASLAPRAKPEVVSSAGSADPVDDSQEVDREESKEGS